MRFILVPPAVAAIAFWTALSFRTYETSRYENARLVVPKAESVRGFKVSIEPFGSLVETHASPPNGRPSLLIVSSDECAACGEEVPRWNALLERVTYPLHVDFVSLSGDQLLKQAMSIVARRGGSYRFWRMNGVPQIGFSAATGIMGVPTTLVLGSDSRLLLRLQRLDAPGEALVDEYLR